MECLSELFRAGGDVIRDAWASRMSNKYCVRRDTRLSDCTIQGPQVAAQNHL